MIFSYAKLRQKIKERFKTQEAFAKALGISRTSLNLKLNNAAEFSQNEIVKAVDLLDLKSTDVDGYFFAVEVQKTEPLEGPTPQSL